MKTPTRKKTEKHISRKTHPHHAFPGCQAIRTHVGRRNGRIFACTVWCSPCSLHACFEAGSILSLRPTLHGQRFTFDTRSLTKGRRNFAIPVLSREREREKERICVLFPRKRWVMFKDLQAKPFVACDGSWICLLVQLLGKMRIDISKRY